MRAWLPRPEPRAGRRQGIGDLRGWLTIVTGGSASTLCAGAGYGAVTAIRALTDPNRLAKAVPSWVA